MITFLQDIPQELDPEIFKALDFYQRVKNGCIEWTGYLRGGYGLLKGHAVHRISYAFYVDDFPKAAFICHHCDNKLCFDPNHLYVGDAKTNALDTKRRNRFQLRRSLYQ